MACSHVLQLAPVPRRAARLIGNKEEEFDDPNDGNHPAQER